MKKLFNWAFCDTPDNNDKNHELDSEGSPKRKDKKSNPSYKQDHAYRLKHEILKSAHSSL